MSYVVNLDEDDDSLSSSRSNEDLDQFRDLLQKRGCICRTYLTARNSRHKGRFRKYCSC